MTTPLRVLIVEDNPDDAELMVLRLVEEGFRPQWQLVGTEAEYLAALEPPPDLILADWRLPHFSGLRALQLLRQRGLDIPFVIVSGSIGEEAAVDAMRQGAYDYVLKDRPARLGLAVRHALEEKRIRQERQQTEEALRAALETANQSRRVLLGVLEDQKQAQEALAAERNLLRTLIDNLPDAIYVKDTAGRFLAANTAVTRLMGAAKPDELLGKTDFDFYPQNLAAQFLADEQTVIRTGRPLINREEPLMDMATGGQGWLSTTKVPLRDGQGQVVGLVGIGRDITERRQLEERLNTIHALGQKLVLTRDMAEIAQSVVDAAQQVLRFPICGLWLVDEEQNRLVLWAHTLGPQAPEIPSLPLDGERGITVAVARSGQPITLPDVSQDPRYVNGGTATRSELCVPLKVAGRVIGVLNAESEHLDAFGPGDRQLMEALADATAIALENARLLEAVTTHREELQRLSAQLMHAQEEERKHISQELHDEIGQSLTAIRINVATMKEQLPAEASPTVREQLEETLMLADETLERVREMSRSLRPSMLDDVGLPFALRWHVNRYARRVDLEVALEMVGLEERLPPEVETVLYRLVQEALNNIAKHAQASQVHIRLERHNGTVYASIEDNGRGFDMQSLARRKPAERGIGLLGMRERVASVGGRFRIHSSPGQGTRVSAEIPLPATPAP
ncbi:MAG: PAS domain-containing protein [Anaerolineae bacterium]|nr:PAS domain-containing protein [Anaerolineae bacterium]